MSEKSGFRRAWESIRGPLVFAILLGGLVALFWFGFSALADSMTCDTGMSRVDGPSGEGCMADTMIDQRVHNAIKKHHSENTRVSFDTIEMETGFEAYMTVYRSLERLQRQGKVTCWEERHDMYCMPRQ